MASMICWDWSHHLCSCYLDAFLFLWLLWWDGPCIWFLWKGVWYLVTWWCGQDWSCVQLLLISFFSTYMLQVMCRISLNKYSELNILEFCLTKSLLKIFPLPTLKDEFVSECATGFNNSLVNHHNYEFPTSAYNSIQ